MGSALQWVVDARASTPHITVPYGLGETADLTEILTVLTTAGLAAVVETYDTIRLPDGRRARLPSATKNPRTTNAGNAELTLLAPAFLTATHIVLAERHPGILLVDVRRRRVWVDGRQVLGSWDQWRDAAPFYVMFAVARMLAVNGGTFDDLVERGGFTPGQVDDALARLGKRVHRTSIGWESRTVGGLVDWNIACYPGCGGIGGLWHSPLPVQERAERLIEAGCLISGRWAAEHRSSFSPPAPAGMPYRLVAYAPGEIDMAALGFTREDPAYAGTELIIPADPTIFTTAKAAGKNGSTDDFITANTLLRADLRTDDDDQAFEDIRNRLQFLADTGYDLRHNLPD
jgi:hypothetical protein